MGAGNGAKDGHRFGHGHDPGPSWCSTGPRPLRAFGIVIVALVVLATACGGGVASGPSSTASFVIDGSKFQVAESGTINVSVHGAPALDYSGPLGCKGQFFHAAYSPNYDLFFRYTAADAVLAYANDVYHFAKAPTNEKGELVWDAQVPDSSGARHHLVARVRCPLPAASGLLDAGS